MREVGSLAPSFSLPSQGYEQVVLDDLLRQHRRVIVFFFLEAGSPGCATEARGFQQRLDELRRLGVGVVGIGPDSVGAVSDFGAQLGAGFPLCSDSYHTAAEEWGTWVNGRQLRATFVVGDNGVILHAFARVSVHSHPGELVSLLAEELGGAPPEPAAAEAPPVAAPASDAPTSPAPATDATTSPRSGDINANGLSGGDVAAGFARASLQLVLAHAAAGGAIPTDVIDLAARVARLRTPAE